MKRSLTSLIALFPLIASCSSSSASPTDDVIPVPPPTPQPATEEPICPKTIGPTVHQGGAIATDEVWTAEGSPHIVEGGVRVLNGKSLTIEPCAVVQLSKGAGFSVAFPGQPDTGTLIAEGTEKRPIVFEGKDGAKWGQIFVHAPGTARFAYATMTNPGLDARAAIEVRGTGAMPLSGVVKVDHVTIEGSSSIGVAMSSKSGFMAGSTDLTIRGSAGRPLDVTEYSLGSLPRGTYTGNAVDEIGVDTEGNIEEDMTMKALGIPYHVGNSASDALRVGAGKDAKLATLTIEAGSVLEFHKGSLFAIELASGDFPASGALVALGTPDRPIVFTSAEPTPAAGDWRGLWFGGVARSENEIANTRIEYTGAPCNCVLVGCSETSSSTGAVVFTRPPPSAFIHDTTIANGSEHGFVLGYDGKALDFVTHNAFEGVGGCTSTLPRDGTCPSPRPACH